MSGIHQFVPMLHRGDAVGRHTMRLRDLLVARGIDARIYVELIDPETEGETLLASTYPQHSRTGRRPDLPVRHGVRHGGVVGRPRPRRWS